MSQLFVNVCSKTHRHFGGILIIIKDSVINSGIL